MLLHLIFIEKYQFQQVSNSSYVAVVLVEVEVQNEVYETVSELEVRLTCPETNVLICQQRAGLRVSNQLRLTAWFVE